MKQLSSGAPQPSEICTSAAEGCPILLADAGGILQFISGRVIVIRVLLCVYLRMCALRDYANKRGWTIAVQVKEVGSGAVERELRQQLNDVTRRREIDVVLV